MSRRHLLAVNKAIKAGAGVFSDEHEPYLELLSTLARQMDDAGGDPSTRLSAAYLSALKDLQKIFAGAGAGVAAVGAPVDELEAFRLKHGVA